MKKEARMIKQPITGEMDVLGSKDLEFNFPLPTLVEGLNAHGNEFVEDTVVSNISHHGSSFYLKNPVSISTRLKLIIDVPEKLAGDKDLKLVIKGKVDKVEILRERFSEQRVTVKFDSKYIIKPGPE
jgi:hypothetical protein